VHPLGHEPVRIKFTSDGRSMVDAATYQRDDRIARSLLHMRTAALWWTAPAPGTKRMDMTKVVATPLLTPNEPLPHRNLIMCMRLCASFKFRWRLDA